MFCFHAEAAAEKASSTGCACQRDAAEFQWCNISFFVYREVDLINDPMLKLHMSRFITMKQLLPPPQVLGAVGHVSRIVHVFCGWVIFQNVLIGHPEVQKMAVNAN